MLLMTKRLAQHTAEIGVLYLGRPFFDLKSAHCTRRRAPGYPVQVECAAQSRGELGALFRWPYARRILEGDRSYTLLGRVVKGDKKLNECIVTSWPFDM